MPEDADERDPVEVSLAVSPLPQFVIARDGQVRAASPPAREMLGIPADESDVPLSAIVTVDSARRLLDDVELACTQGVPVTFVDRPWVPIEGEARLLSGGIVPVDVGLPDGAVAVTVDPLGVVAGELRDHNDELQRDNSELRSIADELRTRTDELNVVAVFLQSVLTSLRGAVVVIDPTLAVRVWNAEAERLWGVPRRLAMRSLLPELDLGFDHRLLAGTIAAGLRGEVCDELVVTVVRPGDSEPMTCSVSVTPLLGPGASVHGATLLFVERR